MIVSSSAIALAVLVGGGCMLEEQAGYWPAPQPGLPPSHRPLPPPPVVVVHRSDFPPPRPAPRAEVVISREEREVIHRYVKSRESEDRDEDRNGKHGEKHGKKKGWKGRGLPPGLAKKADEGRRLPPGWDRELVRGRILPVEVYQECHSLPPEVTVQLPAPPAGTIILSVDGRVVRLLQATREILDVFEIGR